MFGIKITSLSREIPEKNPVKAYKAVREKGSYLLESSEGGEKEARYSFIGYEPKAWISIKDGKADYETSDPVLKQVEISGTNPLEMIKNVMQQLHTTEKAPTRFFGGLVGYLSYDYIKYSIKLPGKAKDDLRQPDAEFILAGTNIIFDHLQGKTYLLQHHFLNGKSLFSKEKAEKKLIEAEKDLFYRIMNIKNNKNSGNEKINSPGLLSNTRKEDYLSNVEKAKDYIKAGDIFQVVLSQRYDTAFSGEDERIYEKLKEINPSPYMYFLDFGGRRIIGSSPEMLARVEGRRVETYPIAGTRPRGKTHAEDLFLEKEMLGSEKEKAEHVMLVDLGRNDIGKVSKYGSVKVERFMEVAKYSHVQHLVSNVSGELREGMDAFDALDAVFPAGTVSGAPKVRAMEIIDELEKSQRGVYSGAIGYFSFSGNMDSAISIRTIILEKDKAYIQVGAGIVFDSQPEAEFQETVNKAQGLFKAIKEADQ